MRSAIAAARGAILQRAEQAETGARAHGPGMRVPKLKNDAWRSWLFSELGTLIHPD